MIVLFFVLIIIVCVILGFIVLIQNPKGGGLNGSIGGVSNQFMGVKQTNDVLEKGTWIFAGALAALCIFSIVFFKGATNNAGGPDTSILKGINTSAPAQQQQAAPTPSATPAPQQAMPKPAPAQ